MPAWYSALVSKVLLSASDKNRAKSRKSIEGAACMTKIRSLLVVFTFCLLAILSFARTAQEDQKAAQERALAEVQKRLAGHEDEPAEKVFANIQILKGKKASRLPGMMSALTGLLGVDCSHCHVPGKWASEEKAAK